MIINIPFGRNGIQVELPEKRIKKVIKNGLDSYDTMISPEGLVSEAMKNPVGSEQLQTLAKGKKRLF